MQKSRFYIFTIALLFIAPITLNFHDYEKQVLAQHKTANRIIASTVAKDPLNCFSGKTDLDSMKKDVLKLEEKKSLALGLSSATVGSWRGLDLSKFPPLQAKLLLERDSEIANDTNIDFSTCTSAPCIINKIYDNGDARVGWITYWFWMKMGYFIAPMRLVTTSSSLNSAPVQNFLYKTKELLAFYGMSYRMGLIYENMPTLNKFLRLPDDMGWSGQKGKCGEFNPMNKTITFNDKCLNLLRTEIENTSNGMIIHNYGTDIYVSFAHEMSHALDFKLGSLGLDQTYFSTGRFEIDGSENGKTEWMKLSGWDVEEGTNAKGQPYRQWIAAKNAAFVSEYAGTSPVEDFAESVANYIAQTQSVLDKIPQKVEFIKKYVFKVQDYSEIAHSRVCDENDDKQSESISSPALPAATATPMSTPSTTIPPSPTSELNVTSDHKPMDDKTIYVSSRALLKSCLNNVDDIERLLKPYTGSTNYVADGVLTCLNQGLEKTIEQDIDSAISNENFPRTNTSAKMAQDFMKKYFAALDTAIEKSAAIELRGTDSMVKQLAQSIKENWKMKFRGFKKSDCSESIQNDIQDVLAGKGDFGLRYYLRFQPTLKIAKQLAEDFCI